MTAGEFIDFLEQQGLLDDKVIAALRSQAAGKKVPPQAVAKLLVDKGHLTSYQSKKLMADLERRLAAARAGGSAGDAGELEVLDDEVEDAGDALAPIETPARKAPKPNGPAGLEVLDDEELTLVDEPASPGAKGSGGTDGLEVLEDEVDVLSDTAGLTPIDDGLTPIEEEGLTPISDADGLEPIDDLGLTPVAPAPAKPQRPAASARPAPVEGLEPIDDGLTPIDDGLTPLGAAPAMGSAGDDLFGAGDPLGGGDPFASGGVATATTTKAEPEVKVKEKKHWVERPMVLLGGGGLIVLVILGITLAFLLKTNSSEEMFTAAQEAYDGQAYANAITLYERFLKAYPEDANASFARVRIGLATMRQNLGGTNFKRGLEVANQILPTIETEPAFGEARPELASLLPTIAEGFVKQGNEAKDTAKKQESLDLARQAMELVNSGAYIPTSLRQDSAIEVRIDRIEQGMLEIERDINREHKLVKALGEMDAAVQQSQTRPAYEIRKALIREYPGLENEPRMREAVRKIVDRERGLVQLTDSVPIAPDKTERPQPWSKRVLLASFQGREAPGVGGQLVPLMLRGSVYGVEAASGKARWRRFVGYDTEVHPFALGGEVDSDILLVDSTDQSLLRVKAADGSIVWRLPLGEPFAKPALIDDRLLVPTASGKLLDVSLASGEPARAAVFPQPLRAAPAGGAGQPLIYQTGDHSNLYVLASDSLACHEVYYVGHREGSVRVPPVTSRGQIFICDNAGADFCFVHILSHSKDGGAIRRTQEAIRLPGNVLVPPLVYERRVVVVTDRGGIYFYEIEPTQEPPVRQMAFQAGAGAGRGLSFPLADTAQLWVADSQLTKYEIQTAKRELVRKWRKDDGGRYVAPLYVIGNVLYHARQHAGSAGITVTAASAADGNMIWQTDLATPTVALAPQPERGVVEALSAHGNVYAINQESINAQFAGKPVEPLGAADRASAYTQAHSLGDGRLVLVSKTQPENTLLYEPGKGPPQVVRHKTDNGPVTTPPAPIKAGELPMGLLLASAGGRVALVDPKSGQELALPFQPPIETGAKVQWLAPAVLADKGEAVIASDQRKIFRVGLRNEPQPHLAELASRALDAPLVERLAAAGESVYGVERGGREDVAVVFSLPSLDFKKHPLKGRVVWGPEQVGDVALLVTTGDGLLCFDGGEEPRWTHADVRAPLASSPLAQNGTLLLATRQGQLLRLSAETGEPAGQAQVGAPLESGPAPISASLLLGGSDGAVYVMPTLK